MLSIWLGKKLAQMPTCRSLITSTVCIFRMQTSDVIQIVQVPGGVCRRMFGTAQTVRLTSASSDRLVFRRERQEAMVTVQRKLGNRCLGHPDSWDSAPRTKSKMIHVHNIYVFDSVNMQFYSCKGPDDQARATNWHVTWSVNPLWEHTAELAPSLVDVGHSAGHQYGLASSIEHMMDQPAAWYDQFEVNALIRFRCCKRTSLPRI